MARQAGNDGDINRLNETSHYVGTTDFERPRLLLPRRVRHTFPPPDAIIPYLAEAGFSDTVPLRDFTFDNSLISAHVERWRPETHTFHLPWGEVTITLQEVAYHLGLRAHGNPVEGCLRDFGRWYNTETWAMMLQLLGVRLPVVAQQAVQKNESFTLKLVWLRDRVRQMPPPTILRSSDITLFGSTVGSHGYRRLHTAADELDLLEIFLVQQSKDQYQSKALHYRVSIDRLRFDEGVCRHVAKPTPTVAMLQPNLLPETTSLLNHGGRDSYQRIHIPLVTGLAWTIRSVNEVPLALDGLEPCHEVRSHVSYAVSMVGSRGMPTAVIGAKRCLDSLRFVEDNQQAVLWG
ncbi:uncharacterized protein DS421_9g283630 [Arachis hypogaea]|nr:uncharacterized protein DS421_9g283630 [Arachis hypogaea]